METRMVLMNLLAGQQWRCRPRAQIGRHGGGRGRRGWEKWAEQHENIYTTICKVERQWEFAI